MSSCAPEIDPIETRALRASAAIHLENEELDLALPYLRTLVSRLPENASTRFNLGLAAWKLGLYDEGRVHLSEFLLLAPNHENAEKLRQLLKTGPGS